MCTASVAGLLFENEEIQTLLANPDLDMVHRQVAITLYALDADHRLAEYESMLPVYLSMGLDQCEKIINDLVEAGVVARSGSSIFLTHPLDARAVESSCGCH
jgi:hypothetical protein